mmetsp:Transcript_16011/g.27243  ORF Transcript_16011/g.27243 Transcript_16011/m.27243 type:complete len:217 (-) Transcript_16011:629-1279(-)
MLKRRRRRRKREVIRRDGVRMMMMMIVRGMVRPFLHWQREMTPPAPPNHPIHPLTHLPHHPTLKLVAMISMQTETAAAEARVSLHPKKLVSVPTLPRMTTCLPPVVTMTMRMMWIMSLVVMTTDPPVVVHLMTCPISLVEMNPVIPPIRPMILRGIPCRHCLQSVCRRSRRLERRRIRQQLQLLHLQRKRQRQIKIHLYLPALAFPSSAIDEYGVI